MDFGTDYAQAARRLYASAQHLDPPGESSAQSADLVVPRASFAATTSENKAVAGYLYGMAAECALKELMRRERIQPISDRTRCLYYMHFPVLLSSLRDSLQGRRQSRLKTYTSDRQLFRDWTTDVRYLATVNVLRRPLDAWARDAKRLVNDMEAR